jgi:hypothetical protein
MPRTPSGNRHALAVLEHVGAVAGRPHQRAGARGRDAHPGQIRNPELAHGSRDARRIGLEQQRDAEHRAIERQLPRMVGDDEHAARRNLLDASGLDAEVIAVEQHDGHQHVAPPGGAHAVGIEAELVEPRRRVAQALFELALELARRERKQRAGEIAERHPDARSSPCHHGVPNSLAPQALEDLFEPEEAAEIRGLDEALSRERDRELEVIDRTGRV